MKSYQPVGTRVLLQLMKFEETTLHIPDNVPRPEVQKLKVAAVGPGVDIEKFPFLVGDVVQLMTHPGSLAGVDKKQELLTVDCTEVNVIVREDGGE